MKLYPLERRGNNLAMSAQLYNFLIARRIRYKYNFSDGGIELADEDYNALQHDYKPVEMQIIAPPKPVPKKIEKKIIKRRLF